MMKIKRALDKIEPNQQINIIISRALDGVKNWFLCTVQAYYLCLSHLQRDDEVGDEEAEHDEDPGPHWEERGNKADRDGAIPEKTIQRIL